MIDGFVFSLTNPLVFALTFFAICLIIGIIAPIAGVGGGVMFTPVMMGFTPIDSYVIRATGLLIAMSNALISARRYLARGLANLKVLFFVGMPYATFAVIGALLAGYVKATMGATGEAFVRIGLGVLVLAIALIYVKGGKKVEYPNPTHVDSISRRLNLGMSYYEETIKSVVSYEVSRSLLVMLCFCGIGLISGFFGLGAGWAAVPVLNLIMTMPLKAAAASSVVLIGLGDTAAIWPYIFGGGIMPIVAVPCLAGMVIGANIGSKLMLKIKPAIVRYIVIAIMFASGVRLITKGLSLLGVLPWG